MGHLLAHSDEHGPVVSCTGFSVKCRLVIFRIVRVVIDIAEDCYALRIFISGSIAGLASVMSKYFSFRDRI